MPQTGAEQADERAGRADRRQHQQPPLQPLDLARDGDVHHLFDAHLQAGERAALAFEAALPFAHRGDEQRRHRMGRLRRQRAIQLFQRLARPERLLETVHRPFAGSRTAEILSITIAHTQTDAISRPSMTPLTIQCACQKRPNSDKSAEASGNASCATAAEIMKTSFCLSKPRRTSPLNPGRCRNRDPIRDRVQSCDRERKARHQRVFERPAEARRPPPQTCENPSHPPENHGFSVKLGQTRASDRSFRLLQPPSWLMSGYRGGRWRTAHAAAGQAKGRPPRGRGGSGWTRRRLPSAPGSREPVGIRCLE